MTEPKRPSEDDLREMAAKMREFEVRALGRALERMLHKTGYVSAILYCVTKDGELLTAKAATAGNAALADAGRRVVEYIDQLVHDSESFRTVWTADCTDEVPEPPVQN